MHSFRAFAIAIAVCAALAACSGMCGSNERCVQTGSPRVEVCRTSCTPDGGTCPSGTVCQQAEVCCSGTACTAALASVCCPESGC